MHAYYKTNKLDKGMLSKFGVERDHHEQVTLPMMMIFWSEGYGVLFLQAIEAKWEIMLSYEPKWYSNIECTP